MQVKIVLYEDLYFDQDSYNSNRSIIHDSITDWEEISPEDLVFLQSNLHKIAFGVPGKRYQQMQPAILVKDNFPVIKRITDLREAIAVQKDKAHAHSLQKQKEAEEKRAKKKQKELEKDEAAARALFEQLKQKYEPTT